MELRTKIITVFGGKQFKGTEIASLQVIFKQFSFIAEDYYNDLRIQAEYIYPDELAAVTTSCNLADAMFELAGKKAEHWERNGPIEDPEDNKAAEVAVPSGLGSGNAVLARSEDTE